MIELTSLSKIFGEGPTAVRAVDHLTLSLKSGTFTALTGPSGSGKSTVLHLIAGLTPPTNGTIEVDGIDVTSSSADESATMRLRKMGYVLQNFSLLPFLNAFDNIAMPLVLDDVRKTEISARVNRVLQLVQMDHRSHHRPSELSGGEQQRIAIARALAISPQVLLADEPTGNLDRAAGVAVMDLMQDINEKTGVTILLVTHDATFAARANRVVRLVDGQIDQEIDFPDNEQSETDKE